MLTAITGVNGFIGGRIFEYLGSSGEVIGFSTKPNNKKFIKLIDGIPLEGISKLDSVIHCGGTVGNGYVKEDYLYGNVECTKNLLKWCEQQKVNQFIFFSTGSIYGQQEHWVDETAALNPENYYAESKLLAEQMVLNSAIPLKTIIRLYFPIGDFKYPHFFSRLANNLLLHHEAYLNDEAGHPYISPVWVGDVAQIVAALITHRIEGIYNLSSNYKLSIRESVKIIAEMYDIKPKFAIKNIRVSNYLGNANAILKAVSYTKVAVPCDILKKMVSGSEGINGC